MIFMKPVQSSLQKWMRENTNFQERHAKIKQEVLNDPEIKQFLTQYPHLTEEEIDKSLPKLYEYKTQSKQCAHCASFHGCKNILQGYSPILRVENNEIHLYYEKCPSRIAYEQEEQQRHLIKSLYMPQEILDASIGDIYDDPDRSEAVVELLSFIEEAKSGLPAKGLYFYGPFGVGKTYLLGALANRLKTYHISSMLIYMPEFVRSIKDSLQDNTVNEKIAYFKEVDVLMLDDIGAETQSAWFRDEVLGSILQYRMMEKKPTFFTSNYSLKQLEKHLAITTRGGVEEVKAGRIIERIRQVSKEVPVFGVNRRDES